MNYGFWLLLGQSTQTTVMGAQLRQMGNISSELQLQRMTQEHQAMLAQILFDLEQTSQRVGGLATHDPIAAGVVGRLKLAAVDGIHAGLFQSIESKRAWAHATSQLDGAWRAVNQHPEWSAFGNGVVAAAQALTQWRSMLGGDPQVQLSALEKEAARQQKRLSLGKWVRLATILGVPGTIVACGVMGAYAGKGPHVCGTAFLLTSLLPMALGISHCSTVAKTARAASASVDAFRGQMAQFNAFLASPAGGVLLEQAARRHPALAG